MTALLLAEFRRVPDALSKPRGAPAAARYGLLDAFTPFPVEGMDELLDHAPKSHSGRHVHRRRGHGGAGVRHRIYSAVIDYPYNSGGRPLDAWPAFMLVPFATGILVAAICGFITFLLGAGLPRLHHPLFVVEGFERASQDRFILALARPGERRRGPPDDRILPRAPALRQSARWGRRRSMTRSSV